MVEGSAGFGRVTPSTREMNAFALGEALLPKAALKAHVCLPRGSLISSLLGSLLHSKRPVASRAAPARPAAHRSRPRQTRALLPIRTMPGCRNWQSHAASAETHSESAIVSPRMTAIATACSVDRSMSRKTVPMPSALATRSSRNLSATRSPRRTGRRCRKHRERAPGDDGGRPRNGFPNA